MTSVRPAGRTADCLYAARKNNNLTLKFLECYKYDNVKLCSMVLLISALPIHTTFGDFDCISRSQQCQTVLIENFETLEPERFP